MNLRILKKLSKRAALELSRRGYKTDPSDGTETIYTPPKLDFKHCRQSRSRQADRGRRYLYAYPLPGTPMVWEKTSYEYDEWDAKTAHEVLSDIVHWESVTTADLQNMLDEFSGETA